MKKIVLSAINCLKHNYERKRFHLSFLLMTFLFFTQTAGAQNGEWQWLNPAPNGHRINDFHVFNENNLIAVGEAGNILLTEDGGESWQWIDPELTPDLRTVFFIDENNGWAVGVNDLLHTSDGGNTWNPQIFLAGNLRSVAFTDPLNGWVVGNIGTMAYTDDGGLSWNLLPSLTKNPLDEILFLDINTGWVTGTGALLKFEGGVVTSLADEFESVQPQKFKLEQNYPNPFNPSTIITFNMPEPSEVSLVVYNMLGQKVATLINQNMTAGSHRVDFDASNLSSGVYLYRITAGNFVQTRKLTLIK